VARRPASVAARLALAALLDDAGRSAEAADEYRQAMDLAPDDADVRAALARHRARAGVTPTSAGDPAGSELTGIIAALGPLGAGSPLSAPLPRDAVGTAKAPPPTLHADVPTDTLVELAPRTGPLGSVAAPRTGPLGAMTAARTGPLASPATPVSGSGDAPSRLATPPGSPGPSSAAETEAAHRRRWLSRFFGRR
jgi:hypothetical protein